MELTPSEKKTTLVGSRSAVFAPLPNLKRVIIEEPENWAYKEERSPYYHASDVAQKRAELEGLKVEKRYLIPRVDDFFREKTSLPKIKVKVKIVDLKKERDAGNFSPLSSQLTRALGKSKQALIYVASGKVKGGV
ncbi:hypothetical protein GTO10_04645, partial [Candidatus Saccharibacteria bacterium]|nr:hypothetical protein [Candidatus Saccharibacteria bacterium]